MINDKSVKAKALEKRYCQILMGVTTRACKVFADFSNNT